MDQDDQAPTFSPTAAVRPLLDRMRPQSLNYTSVSDEDKDIFHQNRRFGFQG